MLHSHPNAAEALLAPCYAPRPMAPGSSLKRSLQAIERAFSDIESTLNRLDKRVRNAERAASRRGNRAGTHRPAKLTPKRRAQLKLQGAYMGFMRQLKPAMKARVKA